MDLASLPREHGLDLATWVKLIKEQGVAFYDSNKGNAPFYTNEKQTIVTYDVQEEKAMGELEAILKEEEIKYKEELSNVENIRISPRDLETSGNITFAPSITSDTPQVTITTTDSIASGTMIFGTGGEIQSDSLTVNMSEPLNSTGIIERFQEITEEEGLSEVNSITDMNIEQQLENTPSVDLSVNTLSAGPLTDQEVGELVVEDPRGRETRGSRTLTSRRGALNRGNSFELTDDTE